MKITPFDEEQIMVETDNGDRFIIAERREPGDISIRAFGFEPFEVIISQRGDKTVEIFIKQ
jgi:hypothetical protein